MLINLDDINIDETKNARSDYGDRDEFKTRIRAFGLWGSVQVSKSDNPDGKPWNLENGFRRLSAVKMLLEEGINMTDDGADLTLIPAEEIPAEMSELRKAELLLAINTSGKSWTPYEQAQQIRILLDNGVTQAEIEKRLGLKSLAVTQRLALLSAPQAIQDALKEDKISATHARAILRVPDEGLQERLVEEVSASKIGVQDLEELVDEAIDEAVEKGAKDPRRKKAAKEAKAAPTPATPAPKSGWAFKSEAEIRAELVKFEKDLEDCSDPITTAELAGYVSALKWVLNA
jgi:ParB family chromosome partitioning protein